MSVYKLYIVVFNNKSQGLEFDAHMRLHFFLCAFCINCSGHRPCTLRSV